ncbi:deoxyribodipyrimidine photo-lyase [Auraticoccus sp. F435]|uniref:Deoxyribodipyrimidine photo-lyase n=1 Tax=Auraticoccus cholistanensis TaxID=2656650 RepID=A0A6A9UTI9_9ACTN|nr:deoxyribodipyrimidine photo-lyase [Auraticoccus cholistanensis]MVA75055.1 deoxyribodipyrimidine photo-lyase [Auraticoccus cholistanensis]
MATSMLWFRRDLRLADHPALAAAAAAGPVLPVFVLDPGLLASAGPVRTHCLLDAVRHLRRSTDGALVVRTGDPAEVVPRLAREAGAGSVHVSAETTPYGRRRDDRVRAALGPVELVATGSPYVVTPGRIRSASGDPYQVFSPFYRAWLEQGWSEPEGRPRGLRWAPPVDSEEVPASPLDGVPDAPELPEVSEAAAQERYQLFVDRLLGSYPTDRDRPDRDGTSQLSVHLKYGTVHPRTLLAPLRRAASAAGEKAVDRFRSELAWRDFYADVVWHRPDSVWSDLKPTLATIEYDEPGEQLQAWCAGRTGYPVVDAGMRQLLGAGWMHNRVRMITASFLVKDLHLWWPHGARHFLRHLRDGDVASNNHGWQWVAGTGTDPSPYFRVFNPVTQGRKFDPRGDYVRRWVPELRHVPGADVHEPWTVEGGYDHGYPQRIVDHGHERAEALRRYELARG